MKMSKVEEAIRLVMQFNAACNRHDVAAMMALLSDDCLFESPSPAPDGTVYEGKKAITQYWQDFFHESPQAQMEIEDILGFGKRCNMHWRCEWVDGSGTEAHIRGVDIFRTENGLIIEMLSYVKG